MVLKVEVWALAEAFTSNLNKVVIACVMNQSQGHWLLFDVFNTCINLTLILEAEIGHVTNGFGAFDVFDANLIIFQNNMQVEVIKIIKPFLVISTSL
jgi:hypothetical protein